LLDSGLQVLLLFFRFRRNRLGRRKLKLLLLEELLALLEPIHNLLEEASERSVGEERWKERATLGQEVPARVSSSRSMK
jgi:hypothetical protein